MLCITKTYLKIKQVMYPIGLNTATDEKSPELGNWKGVVFLSGQCQTSDLFAEICAAWLECLTALS